MNLKFKMDLKADLKEATKLVYDPCPEGIPANQLSFSTLLWLIPFYLLNRGDLLEFAKTDWLPYEKKVNKFFKEAGLRDLGEVKCYLHVFGPHGWFDTADNAIHVRYNISLSTVLHELIHLAVFDPNHSYEDGERAVHKYDKLAKKITELEI